MKLKFVHFKNFQVFHDPYEPCPSPEASIEEILKNTPSKGSWHGVFPPLPAAPRGLKFPATGIRVLNAAEK